MALRIAGDADLVVAAAHFAHRGEQAGGVRELADGLSCVTGDDEDVAHARGMQT
jgi:hypothetical protein